MGVRTVLTSIAITPELLKRFWEQTELLSSGCIQWNGPLHDKGYGRFTLQSRNFTAHSMAWRLANGGKSPPADLNITHKCGNRQCVNVDHLELITNSEMVVRANRTRGRVIKSDMVVKKPIMLSEQPLAKKIIYVWKCLGCGAENRRDSLRVTASAAACNCGVYCQTRNMHKEIER